MPRFTIHKEQLNEDGKVAGYTLCGTFEGVDEDAAIDAWSSSPTDDTHLQATSYAEMRTRDGLSRNSVRPTLVKE